MGRRRIKQYLTLLLVVGVVAVVASSSGTFASFNAQVTNPGNTFASGTLFLSQTASGTTCTSDSNSLNVNPGTGTGGTGDACRVLFSNLPLDAGAQTATLALTNTGTIAAANVKFSVPSCGVGTNSGATGSGTTFGTAPTCANFYLTVQEKTTNSFATDAYCALGPTPLGTTCNPPDSSVTLASSSSFANLKTTGGGDATLGANATRYYVVTIVPTVTADNSLQNRKVTFDLSWQINS